MSDTNHIHDAVMARIRGGAVAMRPRWQFVLLGLLWGLGALLVLLVVLYLASLVVFMLRSSGLWFAPFLGPRGWFDIFRSAPLYIIILTAACVLILSALVRHYTFAYRKPVVLSLGIVLLVTFFGGLLVGFTPLHREIHRHARAGILPSMIGDIYDRHARELLPDDMSRGTVISHAGDFVILQSEDGSTTTIHVSRRTHLPFGADFAPGDMLIVIGDVASGTLEAYGIIEADPDADLPPAMK